MLGGVSATSTGVEKACVPKTSSQGDQYESPGRAPAAGQAGAGPVLCTQWWPHPLAGTIRKGEAVHGIPASYRGDGGKDMLVAMHFAPPLKKISNFCAVQVSH